MKEFDRDYAGSIHRASRARRTLGAASPSFRLTDASRTRRLVSLVAGTDHRRECLRRSLRYVLQTSKSGSRDVGQRTICANRAASATLAANARLRRLPRHLGPKRRTIGGVGPCDGSGHHPETRPVPRADRPACTSQVTAVSAVCSVPYPCRSGPKNLSRYEHKHGVVWQSRKPRLAGSIMVQHESKFHGQ